MRCFCRPPEAMGRKTLQRGATMIEYAILASLISLLTLAAVTTLSSRVRGVFLDIHLNLATSGERAGGGEGEG